MMDSGVCLVTGATGYLGGRLAPRLLEAGRRVRCLSRSPEALRDLPWAARAEVVSGDLLDPQSARSALAGVDVAYYLVHSLGSPSFEDKDRRAAENFAAAAAQAGVRRIVYLGGPVPEGPHASAHLRSRAEVGRILTATQVPAVVLRAAVIIGAGSASFEMLRYLAERLPVMVTPRWVDTRLQPIAVQDVLRYLVAWSDVPETVHRAFDIGGPDVLTYREMLARYAHVAGLPPRVIVPVPPLSPWLSSLWVGLVTPVPGAVARPLVESLVHEAVAHEHDIVRYVPDPPDGLIGFDDAVRLALAGRTEPGAGRPSAVDLTRVPASPMPSDPEWSGGHRYVDDQERVIAAPASALWSALEGLTSLPALYRDPFAWPVRGWLKRAVLGSNPARRPAGHRIRVGETVGWWRVDAVEPGQLLRLRARAPLPGRAWLELRALPDPEGSRYQQHAEFLPKGLAGEFYGRSAAPALTRVLAAVADDVARSARVVAEAADAILPGPGSC